MRPLILLALPLLASATLLDRFFYAVGEDATDGDLVRRWRSSRAKLRLRRQHGGPSTVPPVGNVPGSTGDPGIQIVSTTFNVCPSNSPVRASQIYALPPSFEDVVFLCRYVTPDGDGEDRCYFDSQGNPADPDGALGGASYCAARGNARTLASIGVSRGDGRFSRCPSVLFVTGGAPVPLRADLSYVERGQASSLNCDYGSAGFCYYDIISGELQFNNGNGSISASVCAASAIMPQSSAEWVGITPFGAN